MFITPPNLFIHLQCWSSEALNGKLWKCYWIIWQATIWVIWNARNNIILKNILNSFKTANQRTMSKFDYDEVVPI